MSSHNSSKSGGLLLPFLALVLIHLLSGLEMHQPLILADEVGYLGNARYLSGAAHLPDMQGTKFYHFGYSLFLLPAFWLFSEPVSIYRAVVVINSVLSSSLFFALYYILASLLRVSSRAARWIAFACCLYPSLILYSNFAWSENAFIPFYGFAVALFGRLLVTRSSRDALLFGLSAGFLYTIHPRALPILAASVAYLAALAVARAISVRQLLFGSSAIAAVAALTRLVNQHLKTLGWAGTGEVSATRLIGRLAPDADLPALVERALGQLLYISLASHGLVLAGLVAMIWLMVRKARSASPAAVLASPATGVPLFVLITGAGILAAACTLKLYAVHGPQGLRGAEFIHGRYNESLAVFTMAYALVTYWQESMRRRWLAWRSVVVIVALLGLTAVVMAEVEDALIRHFAGDPGAQVRQVVLPSEVDAIAVPGVYPLVGAVGGLRLYAICLVVIGTFILVTVAMRLSRRGGAAVLVLLFCCFSYYNHRFYVLPLIARAQPRLDFAAEVRRIGDVATIAYDTAHREAGFFPAVQYLLQETVFRRFDSRQDGPEAEVVISGESWPQARRLGARFVTSNGRGSALWVLPGEIQSRLSPAVYEGGTLGAERRPEFQESGFYRQESFAGVPGRWTNGAATLRVPIDPWNPPRVLEIETLAPGRDDTRLQILVNGIELWHRPIPRQAWSRRFGLERIPPRDELLLELRSDTFSPAEIRPTSRDTRRLGIVVTGIRLTAGDRLAEPAEGAGEGERE